MFKNMVSTAVAVSLATFAVAGDLGVGQTDAARDNMADFFAAVSAVLADHGGPEDLPDASGNGSDVSAAPPWERSSHAGRLHQRHLGLGFAHGMGNRNHSSQSKPDYNGPDRIHPGDAGCNGNGHSSHSSGRGHDRHGSGRGFGHRDCGEPSPAD